MTYPPDTEARVRVPSNHLMVELLGPRDVHLRRVEDAFPGAHLVPHVETRSTSPEMSARSCLAHTVLDELLVLVQEGQSPSMQTASIGSSHMVKSDVPKAIRSVHRFDLCRSRQDCPAEDARSETVPRCDTGRTHWCIRHRTRGHRKDVPRHGSCRRNTAHWRRFVASVLSRPAVEAGERLGFLPGDLAAKVDPYLRPLYDALYEMLGPEQTGQAHGARHH